MFLGHHRAGPGVHHFLRFFRAHKKRSDVAGFGQQVRGAARQVVRVGRNDHRPFGGAGEHRLGGRLRPGAKIAEEAAAGDLEDLGLAFVDLLAAGHGDGDSGRGSDRLTRRRPRLPEGGHGFEERQAGLNAGAALRVGENNLEPGVKNLLQPVKAVRGNVIKRRLDQRPLPIAERADFFFDQVFGVVRIQLDLDAGQYRQRDRCPVQRLLQHSDMRPDDFRLRGLPQIPAAMRGRDQRVRAGGDREPGHLQGFFNVQRPVVHAGQYVVVDVYKQ